jgi:hypothetical protein
MPPNEIVLLDPQRLPLAAIIPAAGREKRREVVRAPLGYLMPTHEPPFCERPAVPPIVGRIRRVEAPMREKRILRAAVFHVLGASGAAI